MKKFLPYFLVVAGIVTVIAVRNIPITAPPHSLLEEQQGERLTIIAMIGTLLALVGFGWIGIRIVRGFFSN